MPPKNPAQRMFHGYVTAAGVADKLSARFHDRQHRTNVYHYRGSSVIQIGSKHGTPVPVTVNISDTQGGVLVTMSRGRNWLDKSADAINDICALSRMLAGEMNAPKNPKVCIYCAHPNPPDENACVGCGAPLPVDLPRVCPNCARAHTSDALFCQACGTRLVVG
jgi:hypothetical protein